MSPGTGLSPARPMSPPTRSSSALEVGPALEPAEFAALYGAGTVLLGSSGCAGSGAVVADGRPWKYLSWVKPCPSRAEPTTRPSRTTRLPPAGPGSTRPAAPMKPSGSASPVSRVNSTTSTRAGRRWLMAQFIPRKVRTMSISLMPRNGATSPPSP